MMIRRGKLADEPDHALLERYRIHGDEVAIAAFFARYEHVARTLLESAPQGWRDDVLQEASMAFAKAVRKGPLDNPGAYFIAIVRKRSITQYHRKRLEQRAEAVNTLGLNPKQVSSSELRKEDAQEIGEGSVASISPRDHWRRSVEGPDLLEHLTRDIDALEGSQRLAFWTVVEMGLTGATRELGMSLGCVRYQFQKARENLQKSVRRLKYLGSFFVGLTRRGRDAAGYVISHMLAHPVMTATAVAAIVISTSLLQRPPTAAPRPVSSLPLPPAAVAEPSSNRLSTSLSVVAPEDLVAEQQVSPALSTAATTSAGQSTTVEVPPFVPEQPLLFSVGPRANGFASGYGADRKSGRVVSSKPLNDSILRHFLPHVHRLPQPSHGYFSFVEDTITGPVIVYFYPPPSKWTAEEKKRGYPDMYKLAEFENISRLRPGEQLEMTSQYLAFGKSTFDEVGSLHFLYEAYSYPSYDEFFRQEVLSKDRLSPHFRPSTLLNYPLKPVPPATPLHYYPPRITCVNEQPTGGVFQPVGDEEAEHPEVELIN